MKKLIIGNLKMNLLPSQTEEYCQNITSLAKKNGRIVGLAVPYTSLQIARQYLKDTPILLGAQNVNNEEKGAFTGEISAEMLKELNCDFCLVGHSERRNKFGETNSFINKKIKALLKNGIRVVLCVGENETERNLSKTKSVLIKQIEQALSGLYENEIKSIIIAYEPVWAIGTGKIATTKQIVQAFAHIRHAIEVNFSAKCAENIAVIYGGSVKKENARQFLTNDTIGGVLVGGACTSASEFAEIINCF